MSQWRWFAGSGTETILRLEREWRELMVKSDARITAGPTWQRAYAEAFETNPEIRALYFGSTLAAVGVFEQKGHTRTFAENAHFPVCDVAVDWSIPDVAEALVDEWTDGVPELSLNRLPLDQRLARALEWSAERRVAHVVVCGTPGDASVSLRGGPKGVDRRAAGMTKRDARTKERRLSGLGQVDFQAYGIDQPIPAEALRESFELEASGWKGREGEPIAANPQTKQFYEGLVEYGKARNEMALYVVRLDGRIVAFDLDTRAQGRIDLLKTGYDEELRRASPGNVLRWNILNSEATRGEIHTYHLGRPSEWKMRWATSVTEVGSVRLYSGLRGRAIYLTTVAPVMWAKANLPNLVDRLRSLRGDPPAPEQFKPVLVHQPVLSLAPPPPVGDDASVRASTRDIEPPRESGTRVTAQVTEVGKKRVG